MVQWCKKKKNRICAALSLQSVNSGNRFMIIVDSKGQIQFFFLKKRTATIRAVSAH